jgi:dihydrofolate reductase
VDLGRPLIAIAAVARNRGIGLHNKLPWRIPEDFAFFKATTMGQVLLMGRKTYESIGRPLPGRTTVVLSRSGFTAPGVIVAKDWLEAAKVEPTKTLFLAGGAALYEEALPWCAELILTRSGRISSTLGRSSPGTPPARCAGTGLFEVLSVFSHN